MWPERWTGHRGVIIVRADRAGVSHQCRPVLGVFFVLWRCGAKRTGPRCRGAYGIRRRAASGMSGTSRRCVGSSSVPRFVLFASALWALCAGRKTSLGRGPVAYGASSMSRPGRTAGRCGLTRMGRRSRRTRSGGGNRGVRRRCLALAGHPLRPAARARCSSPHRLDDRAVELILARSVGRPSGYGGRALASRPQLFGSFAVGALLWGIVANQAGITFAMTAARRRLLVGLV